MPNGQLTEIQVSLARVEEGVGHLVTAGETTEKRLNDHASDIKSLNLTRSRQSGTAKALAAVGTFIAGGIAWFVNW